MRLNEAVVSERMNIRSGPACLLALSLLMGCGRGAKSKGQEANLDDLNRALVVWMVTKPNLPPDVSELTNSFPMKGKRLPTPPPGKKLAIDPVKRQVIWADN